MPRKTRSGLVECPRDAADCLLMYIKPQDETPTRLIQDMKTYDLLPEQAGRVVDEAPVRLWCPSVQQAIRLFGLPETLRAIAECCRDWLRSAA